MIQSQLVLLFGLMAVGYLSNKGGILDKTANRKLSRLLVNVAIPATLIHASIGQELGQLKVIFQVFGIAIAYYLLAPFFSALWAKIFHQSETFQLMLTYCNLGFMGLPILSSLYGEDIIFYVTIFLMLFNISMFSHGILLLKRSSGQKANPKQFLKSSLNPGIVGAGVAAAIFFFQIPVPADVEKLIASVSSITTPLAMITIGSSVAEISLREVFADWILYVFAALKLLVYPAVAWLMGRLFLSDPVLLGMTVILTCLPTAGNVSMLCSEYNGDLELASKGVCISTLLFLPVFPIWLRLVR